MGRKKTLAVILLCGWVVWSSPPAYAQDVTFPTARLAIATHEGTLPFTVEVATSDAQHQHGLMFRKTIPDAHGMLFDFGRKQHVDFWMKNTLIPLDMIFIDDHGVITQIAERTEPESTRIIPSDADVRAVLEVAAGTAARYHIAKGDRVLYAIFP